MADQWFVGKDNRQFGPFTLSQLRHRASLGQIKPDDMVWREGMGEWVAASTIPGLLAPSSSTPGRRSVGAPPATTRPPAVVTPSSPIVDPSEQFAFTQPTVKPAASVGHSSVGDQGAAAAQYAEFLPRVGAFVLDALFLGLLACVPAGAAAFLVAAGLGMGGARESDQAAVVLSQMCFSLVQTVVGCIYYVTLDSSKKQGTWGKQIVGIRVTDLQGNRITTARAFGRWAARYLTGLTCGIGLLMPLFTDKKQTLHDMVSGCLALQR